MGAIDDLLAHLHRLASTRDPVSYTHLDVYKRQVLHYAEYVARVAKKRRTRWDYVIKSDGVPTHVWIDCLDDSEGIADWDEDYFAVITNAYVAQGLSLIHI